MLSMITFIFIPLFKNFYFMCMNVLFAHYVFVLHVFLVHVEVKKGLQRPGTRVMEGCEPHAGSGNQTCVSTRTSMLSFWVILQPLHSTFKKQIYLIFAYVCVCLCVCMLCAQVSAAYRGLKRALAPVEV